MFKKLNGLERQISSLEGANLEIRVSSNSTMFKEIKSLTETYTQADIDFLLK